MAWYFRRSLGLGPFRLNLSKSGLGWSVVAAVSARASTRADGGRRRRRFPAPGSATARSARGVRAAASSRSVRSRCLRWARSALASQSA